MAITAALVKELRELTSAGMMDAKKALVETDGDMEAAADWLRTKGLAKAAKKSDRTAAEGLVAVKVDGGKGVAVEVNSETDFVGKNAEFQAMVDAISGAALTAGDVEALKTTEIGGKSVQDMITDKIATIGEKHVAASHVDARRWPGCILCPQRRCRRYGQDRRGWSRFRVKNEAFGKQVAMHIAAVNPASLSSADLDPAVVEKERQIQIDIARESGKPEQVIEKMIEGRMKKFLSEVTLLGQAFVVNPDLTVEAAAKEAGVDVTGFVRLEVGEGIEKKVEDFAAEVAKAAQG
ncbi:translation elongation factor Ts [Marivita sp.]|uniref:translation elongation factor Ts n=1 Tax=Marivita sp. TaxID=2003365 RepID=UPI003B5B1AE1